MSQELTAASRAFDATRATAIGLAANVLLVIIKFAAGYISSSAAMIADATHSLSDMITDVAVIVGFRFVSRPPDSDHEYGHGKIETLITAFCGVMLAAAAFGIIRPAASTLYDALTEGQMPAVPGYFALGAAILSIIVKEGLYHYTIRVGRRLKSTALAANAWHHRSDALSSVGTAIGIGCAASLGGRFALLDPIAAIAVGLLILKAAFSILIESCYELAEASIGADGERAIAETISSCKGVEGFHALRTRRIGCTIAIDAHVFVDPDISVVKGHDIATQVERALKAELSQSTYINIHIEPSKFPKGTSKAQRQKSPARDL